MRAFAVCAAVVVLSRAAHADDFVIPGASNEAGMKTRVAVVNRSGVASTARFRFLGDGSAVAERAIPPMGTLVVGDVLSELWGLSEQRGTVLVNTDQAAAAFAYRYVEVGEGGRAGSALAVMGREDLLGAGRTADFLWARREAVIDLYLGAAGSAVDVTVWSGEGKKLGTRTVAGEESTVRVGLGELLEGEMGVARVQVDVKSGQAAVSMDLPGAEPGRWATVAPLLEGDEGQELTLSPAYRGAEMEGLALRSDVRLFNAGSRAAQVTVLMGGERQAFPLGAGSMVEVGDVVGTWFDSEAKQGSIKITATLPVSAQSRTVGGSSFEVKAVPRALPVLLAGSAALLGGLRGAAAAQALQLQGDVERDGSAELTLRDVIGQVAAGTTVTVAKGQFRQDLLTDLFPGVALPEDGVLEVRSGEGKLDVAMLRVDRTAGDVDWVEPVPAEPVGECARPVISSITTSDRNMTAPGEARIAWATRQADSVRLDPQGQELTASGETTLPVAANTLLFLVAKNGCGESTAEIRFAVGTPSIGGLSVTGNGGQAGGEPGQIFTVGLNGVADAGAVTRFILRDGSKMEMVIAVDGVSEDGLPYGRIPYLADAAVEAGYRTGNFTVAAAVGEKETAGAPLEIRPLGAVSDPVGELRTLLDRFAELRAVLEGGLDEAGSAEAAKVDAEIRRVLDQIEATGQGTLTYGAASAGSVEVKLPDVAALVALNRNYLAQGAKVEFLGKSKAASTREKYAGSCIDDKLQNHSWCKEKERLEQELWLLNDPQPQVFDNDLLDQAFAQGRDEAIQYITKRLQESALNALLGRVRLMLDWMKVVCALQPIRLDGFEVAPKRFPITRRGFTMATELRANLVPKYKQQELAEKQQNEEATRILAQIPQKYNSQKPLIEPAVKAFAKTMYGEFDRQLAALIQQYVPSLEESQQVQVGRCDIDKFYGALNGPDQFSYDPKRAVIVPVETRDERWGRDFYYFQGRRRGLETMCVRPLLDSFLYSRRLLEEMGGRSPSARSKVCDDIQVAGIRSGLAAGVRTDLIPQRMLVHEAEVSAVGQGSVSVDSSTLNAWCFCDDQAQSGIILPGVTQKGQEITESTQHAQSFRWRESWANVLVQKTGPSKWQVRMKTNAVREEANSRVQYHDALAQVRLSLDLPANRANSHTMEIEIQQTPPCQRPASYTLAFSGETGGTASVSQPGQYPFQAFHRYFTGFERGTMQINLGGGQSGFQTVTTACGLVATITMWDGPAAAPQ